MIHVTPHNKHYTYSNQDFDERQALLCDLQKNQSEYLTHKDPVVRSTADWALEYTGIRRLRTHLVQQNKQDATGALRQLYKRLRLLASMGVLVCALFSQGCTAQQWNTTRDVLAATAVIAIGAAVVTHEVNHPTYYVPPVTTTCTTYQGSYISQTRCTTY